MLLTYPEESRYGGEVPSSKEDPCGEEPSAESSCGWLFDFQGESHDITPEIILPGVPNMLPVALGRSPSSIGESWAHELFTTSQV